MSGWHCTVSLKHTGNKNHLQYTICGSLRGRHQGRLDRSGPASAWLGDKLPAPWCQSLSPQSLLLSRIKPNKVDGFVALKLLKEARPCSEISRGFVVCPPDQPSITASLRPSQRFPTVGCQSCEIPGPVGNQALSRQGSKQDENIPSTRSPASEDQKQPD